MINDATGERRFTAAELLNRPDAVSLNVNGDVYHHRVTYRAVPLLALLGTTGDSRFDTLEVQAKDGFISQIPLALIARGAHGGAVPYMAVEEPGRPWPALPHSQETAGPFYLIWQDAGKSGVTREQWPYQVVRLSYVESPLHRWPQLALSAALAADDPARRGQEVYITNCLPCHRLNRGGPSDVGPDLAQPMSPTQYFTEAGLRALIRNPRGVRTWPNRQMIGFGPDVVSDSDLDALIAYLRIMASAK